MAVRALRSAWQEQEVDRGSQIAIACKSVRGRCSFLSGQGQSIRRNSSSFGVTLGSQFFALSTRRLQILHHHLNST